MSTQLVPMPPCYLHLFEHMVHERPTAEAHILDAISEGTDLTRAAHAITRECLSDIGFGLRSQAPAEDDLILANVEHLYDRLLSGDEPDSEDWEQAQEQIADQIRSIGKGRGRLHEVLCLQGALAAASIETDISAEDTLYYVVKAWDSATPGQHEAVMTWAENMIVEQTQNSGA